MSGYAPHAATCRKGQQPVIRCHEVSIKISPFEAWCVNICLVAAALPASNFVYVRPGLVQNPVRFGGV